LRQVFDRCREFAIDVTINTDNAGLHNVRLPWEYENLLTQDVIDFDQLRASQDAAFRHAFAWPYALPPRAMLPGACPPREGEERT
jgi:adenosine deaminase